MGLSDYLERYPRQLSGGQRQRVAMGRAIVRKPSVFLFDEPLSNLDAALRVQMRAEIRALHRRLGVTSIYVTHDQIEAMTMADKIVVLRNGAVEQVGPPLELYDRPANTFVAQFIGSPAMNLIAGTAKQENGAKIRFSDGTLAPLATHALREGQDVMLGVRPEHLQLSSQGIPGEVALVEPLGMTTQIAVKALGQLLVVMAMNRATPALGEKVHLFWDPASVLIFDRSSGTRIG